MGEAKGEVMKTVTLDIAGMACEDCVSAVHRALLNVDGVRRADISLEHATARVAADDAVEEQGLMRAVEAAGHAATLRD